jgi:hypothetical protein
LFRRERNRHDTLTPRTSYPRRGTTPVGSSSLKQRW